MSHVQIIVQEVQSRTVLIIRIKEHTSIIEYLYLRIRLHIIYSIKGFNK